MNRRITFFVLVLLVPAFFVNSASAYEPTPPPWLEEFQEHPPGLPPPPPAGSQEASPDTTPPDTMVVGSGTTLGGRWREISFISTEEGSSFACRFDGRESFPCASPLILRHLGPGPHNILVAAIDPAGNVDQTPAVYRFRVTER
jgi:hypothetical protein